VTENPDYDVSSDLTGAYIKKQDVADGDLTLVITAVEKMRFEARSGKPAEEKWVLTFAGVPTRMLGLNKTNLAIMARTYGRKTGAWIGQRIVVTLDESVSFGGQLVGGLRIRIPKPARKPVPDQAPESAA
jgi:hypothetical protein